MSKITAYLFVVLYSFLEIPQQIVCITEITISSSLSSSITQFVYQYQICSETK